MGFKILDKDNNAIPINQLDKEIAELWGKECDPKHYAVPRKRDTYPEGRKGQFDYITQSNWFDTIGWRIHFNKTKSWDELKKVFEDDYAKLLKEFNVTIEKVHPEIFKAINTFKEKGYTPVPVED